MPELQSTAPVSYQAEIDLSPQNINAHAYPLAGFVNGSAHAARPSFHRESLHFLFPDVERLEMILGFTTLLPTKLAQTSFDAEVRQPDVLLESMITSRVATNILERKVLPNLADIGDSSAGLTAAVDMESIPMRMDVAVFR